MREQVGEGVVAVRGAEVSPRAWGGYRPPAPSPPLGREQAVCSLPGRGEGADRLLPPRACGGCRQPAPSPVGVCVDDCMCV